MNDYEQALIAARETSVILPEFEAIVAASESDRATWIHEGHDARARARRWLLFAAVVWMSLPPLAALESEIHWHEVLREYLSVLPPALLLLWAARLSHDRRLRSAILTRAIAASTLVLALLTSRIGLASWSVVSVLLAVGSGRSLQLLGERDFDGSEDPNSSFEPVKFRGILILALVIACADASMLLYTATVTCTTAAWAHFAGDYEAWSFVLPTLGMTTAAAALMVVNVWGLLRLRTWALISNMFANVGIAAVALAGMLTTGPYLSAPLVTTAGIQLLLPLPILAAALGLGGARRYEWVGAVLLRVVVPMLVLATIVSAIPW
jgi:hypothetical protein